ncbi:MAG: condensation domain-containing protein, partial [Coleofasciculus sp. S288]|nr:condensation domain-containing protein [Coleofasciculus sp. S288]
DALEQNWVVVAQPTQGNTRTLVSCGQSMLEQQIAIANPETLTLCPPDQIGEIWVSGSSVAQGYWKRREATTSTFQAYLADTRTGPFLRTGDLGFIRNGELFITGRLKDLIVIRGHNYYPQDIEQTVAQSHPSLIVGSSAVFGVEVKSEERLAIVQEVQRTALKTLDVEAVAMAIRQAVTGKYEVPVYAVVLLKPGTIPKTSSGKIQRFACRQKFLDGSLDVVGSQILEPPDSELPKVQQPLRWWRITRHTILALSPSERLPFLESYLKEQVARVLQVSVSQIDQQLPLSHLGLDSLMLLGLRLQLEQELDTPLPNNFLDEDVSLSQLTEILLHFLITDISEGEMNSALSLSPSVQGDVPLTPIQHQFLEREQPDFNYDQTIFLYLRSPKYADHAVVEQVLQHILTYHDAFRLRFIKESDRWRQFYAKSVETVAFQHIDASELPRSEWKFLIEQRLEDLNRSLNLSTGPLLRAALVDFGSQHPGALLLVLHHLVSDAVSCKIVISDIRRFYEQLSRGETITPLPKTTSYKDWAEKLAAYAQTEAVRQELPFWLSLTKLKFPMTRYQLPVDFPGGINSRASIARVEQVVLSPLETRDFQQKFPTDLLESALLTALTQAFCNWTGQSFLYVELDRHGREHSFKDINLSRTVGFFLCHFPIRLELGTVNAPSPTPVWQQIHAQIQRVPNNGISYGLLRYLNQDADVAELMRRIPQPQVHFTYQSNRLDPPQSVASFPLILSEVRSNSRNVRDYLLTVRVSQMRGSLHCSFGYSTELHRKSSIEALVSHFTQALRSLLT